MLQIDVKVDLPVGKNLQDHGMTSYYFAVDAEYGVLNQLSNPQNISDYVSYRSGMKLEKK